MENKNYTIKDIARMAGVSAGTVDRVLHNRGDVSRASRDKVQKVLDEIDYHPNMFAIGLAAKKRYHIVCIIPYYIEHDYWHSVAAGIDRAAQELRRAGRRRFTTRRRRSSRNTSAIPPAGSLRRRFPIVLSIPRSVRPYLPTRFMRTRR